MINGIKKNNILFKLIFLTGVFVLMGYIIQHYFFIIIVSLVLYFFSKPIFNLINLTNENKNINAAISICLVNAIIFIFIFFAGRITLVKINNLITYQLLINNEILGDIILNSFQKLKESIQYFNFQLTSISKYFNQKDIIIKSAVYTMDVFYSFFIGNTVAYFLLLDKTKIIEILQKIFPEINVKKMTHKVAVVKNIISMQIILSLITVLITTIAFALFRIQSSIYLGVFCGILDILPYIGMIVVFVPLIVFKIKEKNFLIAILLGLLYIVIIFARQLVENNFVSKSFNIHPLAMIICLYVFMKFFGVVGIFIAPLYLISVKELIF